ncbi:hypothetical protein BOQ62_00340 [Chryseobacterium sp. CH21]|uniref:hypothetical protein n=1 Tax=Chryseobacterium sp. CH21 TaxID=713556 RepID=UPI00100B3D41|nr:hypothetical protein [Chryseobacterium sp. CH21]RXM41434.1 hypothetical protein BOQ62_00340 [Chryseobacterium sp. CH21]
MDETKMEFLDLINDKYLIDEYFKLKVKRELNINIDLSSEYVTAHNIVSKKLILVQTFSHATMENPQLYLLLRSLIHNVNSYQVTKTQMISDLNNK